MGCSRSWPSPTAWRCSATRSSRTRAVHDSGACWLAVLAYALQIYCDFSGYSDMALGPRPPARLQADASTSTCRTLATNVAGLLAALAHLALDLAARLPVHPAGRQPRRAGELPQPDDHDDARRAVARGRVGLRPLGRCARPDARRPPAVPGLLRSPPAADAALQTWLGTGLRMLLRSSA